MKGRRIVRKMIAISLIILLINISGIIQSFYSNKTLNLSERNQTQSITYETIETLNVSFNSSADVTNHVFKAPYLTTFSHFYGTEHNLTYAYDSTKKALKISGTRNQSGLIFLSGLTPSIRSTISLDVILPNGETATSNAVSIYSDLIRVGINYYGSYYKYSLTWYNETGTAKSTLQNSQVWGYTIFVRITIEWYENRTFKVSFIDLKNGDVEWTIWNKTRQDTWKSSTPGYYESQPEMLQSYIALQYYVSSAGAYNTWYNAYIKNFTQKITIPKADVQGIFPTKKYVAWGFDGPYNQTRYLSDWLAEKGAKVTMFYSYGTYGNGGYNDSDIAKFLSYGFEVGWHAGAANKWTAFNSFKTNLTWLINKMTSKGWVNQSFAWTALGNGQHGNYTTYMWQNYHSIGRIIWAHSIANIGHFRMTYGAGDPNQYNFSAVNKGLTETACPWVAYAHTIGYWSPELTNESFKWMLNRIYEKGMQVIGYMEWWARYNAPYYVTASMVKSSNYQYEITYDYQNLTLKTIPVELAINLSRIGWQNYTDLRIYDNNHNEIPYNISDDGYLIFNATEGKYILFSWEEYYNEIPEYNSIQIVVLIVVLPLMIATIRKSWEIIRNRKM